jgi:RNA polymerase sigma-70 factor (sigma-E family)
MAGVDSFDEFVRVHVGDLVRMAYVITWDEFEAEDLVQECLFRISRRWSTVGGMDMPLAYARRVVANLAFDGRRRRLRRRVELNDSSLVLLADRRSALELDALEQRSELAVALSRLTRQQRTVLGLRYFLDLSEAEVAAVLGCSAGNVKSTASRALSRLREMVVAPSPASEVCDQ